MNETALQNKALAVLLALVTIAFVWILLPYYGAIFWAVILGILFAPLQRNLLMRFGRRRNVAAAVTTLICLLVAVLPVIVISGLLVQEGATLYQRIQSGQLDIAGYVERGKDMLPTFAQNALDNLGMGNLEALRDKITTWASQGSQVLATQAFSFGQVTFDFVVGFGIMMYLLFFFLREGAEVVRKVRMAVPLPEHQKRRLQLKFKRVVRATVKGNVLVAIPRRAGRLDFLDPGDPQRAGLGGDDGFPFAAACRWRRHRLGAGGDLLPDDRRNPARRDPDRIRRAGDRPRRQRA